MSMQRPGVEVHINLQTRIPVSTARILAMVQISANTSIRLFATQTGILIRNSGSTRKLKITENWENTDVALVAARDVARAAARKGKPMTEPR
jgi:hypothetical protein